MCNDIASAIVWCLNHFLNPKGGKKLGLVKKLLFFHILKIEKIEKNLFELAEVFLRLRNIMIMMISNTKE